jgi:small-conductance mechanosensitive channel
MLRLLFQQKPSLCLAIAGMDQITDTLLGIWKDFLGHLPLIIGGILVLFATAGVSALAKVWLTKLLTRFDLRLSLQELFNRLIRILIWILGICLAAMIMFPSMSLGSAVTALGLGSVAIGFAFKDIFENFFAGILILWRFPLEPGDYLEIDGYNAEGEVEDITIRNTLLRTVSDELIVVPNSILYKNPVIVLTNRDHRRQLILAGIDYEDDVGQARQVIAQAVENCKSVDKDHEIQVFVHELGSSSVNFEVAWWANPRPVDMRRSRDEVISAIKQALDSADITIPFPQRTHSFREHVGFRRIGPDSPAQGDETSQAEHQAQ